MNRRDFLKYMIAAGATAFGPGCDGNSGSVSNKPNFLVLLTDQERNHLHWPPDFVNDHLSSWDRLRQNGLTFEHAFNASSQCSPSRACLLTGHFSNINKVPTLDFPGGLPGQDFLANIGSWLKAKAGYEVVWKGKWHLSYPLGFQGGSPDNEMWTEADIDEMENKYGFSRWNPPEAGNNVQNTIGARATMGGGNAENDGRFVRGNSATSAEATQGYGESAMEYIARLGDIPANQRQPFCLFISLVNPHDIAFFPNGWDLGGYGLGDFQNLDINLPPNFPDDLSTKPSIQKRYYEYLQSEAPLSTEADHLNYDKILCFFTHIGRQTDQRGSGCHGSGRTLS